MEADRRKYPINVNLTIEPASLQKIVEEGRLMEFVDALSAQASLQFKAQVIDQVAKGAIAQGGALVVRAGFDDGDEYGTHPPIGPFPPKGIWEDAMRQVATENLAKRMTGGR